jgi:CheY-like chemotaxis protein
MQALILEDDPLILSLLQRVLVRRGYDVVTYPDPTACPIFTDSGCPCSSQPKCPDIILTDFNMPSVNGIEFVEHLQRKGCKCRNIAMISGSWTAEDLQHASPLGVSVFAKPFHLQRLESWLGTVERMPLGCSVS